MLLDKLLKAKRRHKKVTSISPVSLNYINRRNEVERINNENIRYGGIWLGKELMVDGGG